MNILLMKNWYAICLIKRGFNFYVSLADIDERGERVIKEESNER